MPLDLWASAQREVDTLIQTLVENPVYISFRRSLKRITVELLNAHPNLQNIDPHGSEYFDRLKEERGL